MVSIEEALSIIKNQKIILQSKSVALIDGIGCFLAEEIIAPFHLPTFDNSAMDGYAVCGLGQSFEIIGEVAAGDVTDQSLEEGQAMRIFTGGKIPYQTTAVIMQEHTSEAGGRVHLQESVVEGKNIRKKGGQLTKGQLVFAKGQKINPATIGLIGSLGLANIKVYRKPSIRIIATGNELVQPGETLQEGQIFESNTGAILGALNESGFPVDTTQTIADDLDSIQSGIQEDLKKCDVLLLSGGISVGEYDFVKQALETNRVKEQFYKVRQKPGKPLYFGRKENKFVFALPGNPASSLTCFYMYVLPLLDKLSGGEGEGLQQINMPLTEDFHFKSDRPAFLKSHIENGTVTILDGQGSSMIYSMAKGNSLVFLNDPKLINKGDLVTVIPL